MIVVMQEGATEAQVEAVISRLTEEGFDVHRSTGVMHTVLGGVGGKTDFDTVSFAVMEGVKEAHPIVSPYKLASRSFKPTGTVIKIKDVQIGGGEVVAMAGPCSVEGKEQIEISAEIKIRVIGQIDRRGRSGGGFILDHQRVVVVQPIRNTHGELSGIALLASGAN